MLFVMRLWSRKRCVCVYVQSIIFPILHYKIDIFVCAARRFFYRTHTILIIKALQLNHSILWFSVLHTTKHFFFSSIIRFDNSAMYRLHYMAYFVSFHRIYKNINTRNKNSNATIYQLCISFSIHNFDQNWRRKTNKIHVLWCEWVSSKEKTAIQ